MFRASGSNGQAPVGELAELLRQGVVNVQVGFARREHPEVIAGSLGAIGLEQLSELYDRIDVAEGVVEMPFIVATGGETYPTTVIVEDAVAAVAASQLEFDDKLDLIETWRYASSTRPYATYPTPGIARYCASNRLDETHPPFGSVEDEIIRALERQRPLAGIPARLSDALRHRAGLA